MKIIFLLGVFFLVVSCKDRMKLRKELIQLQSQEINLNLDKMQLQINGRDTLITDFSNSELKLVVFTDSTLCSSCAIKRMQRWNDYIETAKKYNGRLKFYFIFSPAIKDIAEVDLAFRANIFDYPMFLDANRIFVATNPHLPENTQLHTFLLDENNKVILVGDPSENSRIKSIFYKILDERLNGN